MFENDPEILKNFFHQEHRILEFIKKRKNYL